MITLAKLFAIRADAVQKVGVMIHDANLEDDKSRQAESFAAFYSFLQGR